MTNTKIKEFKERWAEAMRKKEEKKNLVNKILSKPKRRK